METLNLTPAEQELIRINREAEALQQQKREAELAQQLEKDIAAKQKAIAQDQNTDQAQIAAAKQFVTALGTDWKLNLQSREQLYEVKKYTNPDNPSSNGYERETVWQQTVTRNSAVIGSTDGKYVISVVLHNTYYSGWRSGIKSSQWKMQMEGPGVDWKTSQRYYSNAKTINDKIQGIRKALQNEQDLKQRQASAIEQTRIRLQQQYPDAMITTKTESERSWSGKWIDADVVTIKFTNGIELKYRVYVDGSLSRKDIVFGNVMPDQVIAAMSQLQFPEIEK